MNSVNIFSVRLPEDYHALYSFFGVPEGAYYERIFHLFSSLRVCHLLFQRYTHYILDSQFVLPSDRPFMPIQTSLLNLQSLKIECSIFFLPHS
jgi:hypothetical protein